MKKLLFTGIFAALMLACFAQKPYKVVFYNLENLFDTINDPEKLDDEFTPEGPKKWNTAKYNKKLGNIEKVLADITAVGMGDRLSVADYPVVIGVSEIENRSVLEDLVSMRKLAPARYRICHYDSPDRRGVDVAFVYRADVFRLEGSAAIPYTIEGRPDFRTRDIVTMWGTIEGEPFYFMVAHWPSRLGGQSESEHMRVAAAKLAAHIADSLWCENPSTGVVVMGDLNDDPHNKSVAETLGAVKKIENTPDGGFFNPFWEKLDKGIGSYIYRGGWDLFDQIIVNKNLVDGACGLKYRSAEVLNKQFLLQSDGKYRGYPHRTFSGGAWTNGYSDHLPTEIFLVQEVVK